MTKIIQEANCRQLYLVIPRRWKDSQAIKAALEFRNVEATVLKEFDFSTADRQARAKVELVKVNFNSYKTKDPFDTWFDQEFKLVLDVAKSDYAIDLKLRGDVSDKVNSSLTTGTNLIDVLENLYLADLKRLYSTYQSLAKVDASVLAEVNVDVDAVRTAMKNKIKGLKNAYWLELFNNLNKVTDRLTAQSRQRMLDKLMRHTSVDYTAKNAHAILCWVIKNANSYFDRQLISTYESMISSANIVNYKSNQRVFSNDEWKYSRKPDSLKRYKLDYRIVVHRYCTLETTEWHQNVNGLTIRAANFLDDLNTIARNLGYDTLNEASHFQWESNKLNTFKYFNHTTGEDLTLFEVRAFLNGNFHFKFNQEFMTRLNIEFGRLKGWVKNAKEASVELDIDGVQAEKYFNSQFKLSDHSLLYLTNNQAA